jgi:hypothetical protein
MFSGAGALVRPRLVQLGVLACLLLAGVVPAEASGAWTPAGGALNVGQGADAELPSATAVGGVPYVAWDEGNGMNNQVYVRHWSGSAWVLNGGALNVNPAHLGDGPSIANVGGVPYVAWREYDGTTNHVYVKHWNGSAWVQDGGALNLVAAEQANSPSIASVGGVPYVAFVEQNGSTFHNVVFVVHLSAGSWTPDGSNLSNTAQDSGGPSISSVAGTPYVAFSEGSPAQVYVEHFGGNSWVQDGSSLNVNTGVNAGRTSIAGVGGVPYVAWHEGSTLIRTYVKHLSGAFWTQDGGALNLDNNGSAGVPSMASIGGRPEVATEQSVGGVLQIDVEQWSGTAWNQVGGPLSPSTATLAAAGSLADVGGVPFVAWGQRATSGAHSTIAAALLVLTVRVRDNGAPWPIGFQYGPGSSLSSSTPAQSTDGTGSATIVQAIGGLSPGTSYSWRAVALDGADAFTFAATSAFATQPANGPGGTGATGPKGATGPAGPAGPAGKVELVTCKTVTQTVTRRVKGRLRRVKVNVQKCTAQLVNGPVKFTVRSASAGRLTRGSAVYARVEVLRDRRTMRLIVVHRVRKLTPGSYTLVTGGTRQTVQIA